MFLEKLFGNRRQKPITREQWFLNLDNLERLREILTDPVFVAATNYLIDSRRLGEAVLLADPESLSRAAAFSAGHATFLTDLERLAIAPNARPTEPEPFEYINSDNYTY